MVTETAPAGKPVVNVKQPSRKEWECAQRAATVKERIAPGVWHMQSATNAGVTYTVDVAANTCQCPAARHPDCWHRATARAGEEGIVQEAERKLEALKARYGGAAGLMQAFGMEDV